LEASAHDCETFIEPLARLAHRNAHPVVLAQPKSAARSNFQATPIEHVVECDEALSHLQGVVPRQHDNHRTHRNSFRDSREVRKELGGVRYHRVGRVMVLDSPERVKAQWLDHEAQSDLFTVDLAVAYRLRTALQAGIGFDGFESIPVAVILGENSNSNVHYNWPFSVLLRFANDGRRERRQCA
jgi:hypothetical protein